MSDHPEQRLTDLLERAEVLYRDHTFQSVRRWKQQTGGLAVGYLPVYVPREMLYAQNALPVGIVGAGEDLEIIKGDAFYQSYICHLPRSVIEMGLNGSLDCLDAVLFPATCDVIRNLSGMWKMQFEDKLVRYLDVPQNFDPEIGGVFYRHELEEFSADLEKRGAAALEPERLGEVIGLYNTNRERIKELYQLRSKEPWKVPTHELYLMLRAGLLLPVEEHTSMLDTYRELIEADQERRPLDQARVLLTGSFCEQPPLGLIKTLERSGCYIVDDDFVQIHRWLKAPISTDGDPMSNLVTSFLEDGVASSIRYIDEDQKGRELLDRIRESGAEGILFCAPSFCDPALLDEPMMVAAVEREGIPWTAFKYSENTGQFQTIREQSGTFADSIKLWSGV